MPYIPKTDREIFDDEIGILLTNLKLTKSPGNLNYCFSRILWALFDEKPSYTKANELLGVLEAVKQEFYRRQVAPYEDAKRQENGDILKGTPVPKDIECPYCLGKHSFQACPHFSRVRVKPDSENLEYFNSHHGY